MRFLNWTNLLLALLPLSFLGCEINPYPALPEKVENFKAVNIHGDSLAYKNLKGEATLVVFFASWCGYCVAEIPTIKKLESDYAPRGLRVIGINEDDTISDMGDFIAHFKIQFPVLHWNYEVMNRFGNPNAVPAHFLMDKTGKIQTRILGTLDETKIRFQIETLLQSKSLPQQP